MKKCPYCSAELLDDAEFCLYCMRQLTPKIDVNKKIKRSVWPFVVISVLLALLACAIILLIIKFGLNYNQYYSSGGSSSSITSLLQNGTSTENEHTSIDSIIGNYSSEIGYESTLSDNSSDDDNSSNYSSNNIASNNSETEKDDDKKDASSTPSSESSEVSSQTSSSTSSDDTSSSTAPVQTWSTKTVNGGVEIIGIANYNSTGNYEIPSQIDGKTVVGIGFQAFYYEQNIKSIVLPDTLKYIGEQSFAYCDSLTQIIIPASVTEIRNNAFVPCKNLSDIYIKSTNITIATYAFSNSYQRDVTLTIHAPSSVMNSIEARICWSAEYDEWN